MTFWRIGLHTTLHFHRSCNAAFCGLQKCIFAILGLDLQRGPWIPRRKHSKKCAYVVLKAVLLLADDLN